MGFMAGFAETLVDQYNKNAEAKEAEKQMSLKYRLDELSKKRDEWDEEQKKEKELMSAAEVAAQSIPGSNAGDLADWMKKSGVNDPLKVVDLYSSGEIEIPTSGGVTVEVPNDEIKKPTGVMPEAVTNPSGVPNAETAQTQTPIAGVVQESKPVDTGKYRKERTPDPGPIPGRPADELDEVDERARKIAPSLFDYDKPDEKKLAEAGKSSGIIYKPKTKEVKLDDIGTIQKRYNDARIKGDKAGMIKAQSDIITWKEAKVLEAQTNDEIKKATNPNDAGELDDLYVEKDRLSAAGKDTSEVDLKINAKKRALKDVASANKPDSSEVYVSLDKNGYYAGPFRGKVQEDGSVINIDTGNVVPPEERMVAIDPDIGKRIVQARQETAKTFKDYNTNLASVAVTVQAGAKLAYLVNEDPTINTQTAGAVATFKDYLGEGSAILKIFGAEEGKIREGMAYLEGVPKDKVLSEEEMDRVKTTTNYLTDKFLSAPVSDMASKVKVAQALKTLLVYSMAASNGETARTMSNLDMEQYQKSLSGRGEDIVNQISEIVGTHKTRLMTQERELNGANNPMRALQEELGGKVKFKEATAARFDDAVFKPLEGQDDLYRIAKRITGGNSKLYNKPSSGQAPAKPAKVPGQIYPGKGGKKYRYVNGPENDPNSYEEVK